MFVFTVWVSLPVDPETKVWEQIVSLGGGPGEYGEEVSPAKDALMSRLLP